MKGQPRVLVVDDDVQIRNICQRFLEAEGWFVMTVGDGQLALGALERKPFDIAIIDWFMPDLDGLEVLEHAVMRFPHTDFVLMTGYGNTDVAVEAMKKGAKDYLEKPFNQARIAEVVRGLLENKNISAHVLALRLDQLLKDNLANRAFGISQIQEKFGYCESHIYRLFKEAFDMPPGKRLKMHRMNYARHLLKNTDDRVSDIGQACGFGSPQRFRNMFFREENISPRQYRKNCRARM